MKKILFIISLSITIISCTSKTEVNLAEKEKNRAKVLYSELTPKEFRQRIAEVPIAYLPLGTLEWHGEHLPLGADAIQPYYFFQEIAAEVGGIVLPPYMLGPDRQMEQDGEEYYGMDQGQYQKDPAKQYEMQKLAGSAYWIPDTLYYMIVDATVKQLARQGFKIILAHGHGPSTVKMFQKQQEIEEKYNIKMFNLWGSENDEWKGFMTDHAAMSETSVIMHYRPDLVQMENLSSDSTKWPIGVGGKDPRVYASPEKGLEIANFHKNRVIRILKDELSKL